MLVIHRSERADRLLDALDELLAVPPEDPIAPEVVAVPTRGVERWLAQSLSHRWGVCANVRFPFPGILVGEATAVACGIEADADPWRPERAVWPLVDVLDEHVDDPVVRPLVAHLEAAAGAGPQRRLPALRHLADLYDHYGVHRPSLLRHWLADGDGGHWQAFLWRRLRERIGEPSPAERFATAVDRLVAAPELLDLPARLSLFGLTRLPASHLDVLQAVAAHRDVHLFLLHPSGELWDRVAPLAAGLGAGLRRRDDPTRRLPRHPLLRSWARDAREMQLALASRPAGAGDHRPVVPAGEAAPATALARLQADVRGDRPLPGAADRAAVEPADDSLRVHACHGRSRQVEVARDAILHLLSADPTLEPRDVIVMCPDIESFAPLVHAAFGPDEVGGSPLRVRLADRSLRQTNPLLAVAAELLELADSRATASAVLDFAGRPPVARRFRVDHDDLATLEEWAVDAGARWGLDLAQRRRWGISADANTWSTALDRLLAGVAMSGAGGRLLQATVPLDEVPSGAVDLAGRFAELLARLGSGLAALRDPQPLGAWMERLVAGVEAVAVADEDWQHDQLRRVASEVLEEAAAAPRDAGRVFALSEVRALLGHRLQGRPTRANFRTGDLTICTLVPMRSVPHRVVVLLGLDDGVFPRHPEPDGDDLLLADPCVGDRDARSEDRQLLLDALLAAEEHLVITYAGRDQRTNRPLPPAVPVAELLDVVDATFRGPDGAPARESVLVHHPLHSFDPRNFAAPQPWGFDPVDLEGARASLHRDPPAPWLAGPLPRLEEPVIQLDDLVRFVEHPVRTFLRRRLGLFVSEWDTDVRDVLPIDLQPLDKWGVGTRLLQAALDGVDLARAETAERGRGFLLPGALADDVLAAVRPEVEALHGAVTGLGLSAPGGSLDVHVELEAGRALIGTVAGVRGTAVVSCSYSRLAPKHRLAAWVRFLALTVARPDLQVCAITVGRGRSGHPPTMAVLRPLGAGAASGALATLAELVDLYDRSTCEPLPLYCDTSAAWAAARAVSADPQRALDDAEAAWKGRTGFPGEQDDPEHRLVWGRFSRLADRLAQAPMADETGEGWAGEPSRFGVLARRVWDPLLAHETLGPVTPELLCR